MRSAIVLSALATGVASLALATASTARADVLQLHHKPFSTMNRQGKISYLKRQKWHDKSIIRWWKHHRELADAVTSSEVRWATNSLKIVKHNLHQLLQVPVVKVIVQSGVIQALMCIHGYEGSWTDSGAPYWGGLQMDLSFQSAYGPEFVKHWGTADHWPVWAQLAAGERAVKARGYSPWPNTARYCGLY